MNVNKIKRGNTLKHKTRNIIIRMDKKTNNGWQIKNEKSRKTHHINDRLLKKYYVLIK